MRHIFTELKRRNVTRVAAAYAVLSWLLIQIAVAIEAPLHLPDWFDTATIVLLAAGFPIALLLTWTFVLTPDGIKRTRSVNPQSSLSTQMARKLQLITIGALVLALCLVVIDSYILDDAPEPLPRTTDKSIAVLPLRDLSPNGDQAWLANGISEEISRLLTPIDELIVIDTNSSFRFREPEDNFRAIRDALHVNYLLSGSLRRLDDQLSINVHLISTVDGSQVWAENYPTKVEDIFAIQEEIANRVSIAMQLTLAIGNFSIPGMTRNFSAYEEYLKGFDAINSGETIENVRTAIDHFERALAIDPTFTRALIALYRQYTDVVPLIADSGRFPEREARATEALAQIRAINPNDPALLYPRVIASIRDNRLDQAERLFNTAMSELRRAGMSANELLDDFAFFNLLVGKPGTAMGLLERTRVTDPFNVTALSWLVETLAFAGDMDRAWIINSEALALRGHENNPRLLANRLLLTLYSGDAQLLDNYAFALPNDSGGESLDRLMIANHRRPESALEILYALSTNPDLPMQAYVDMSVWAAYFGDPELTANLLRRVAVSENHTIARTILFRPIYSETRRTAAFRQLVTDLGLVAYWRSSGQWGDFCRPLSAADFECF